MCCFWFVQAITQRGPLEERHNKQDTHARHDIPRHGGTTYAPQCTCTRKRIYTHTKKYETTHKKNKSMQKQRIISEISHMAEVRTLSQETGLHDVAGCTPTEHKPLFLEGAALLHKALEEDIVVRDR